MSRLNCVASVEIGGVERQLTLTASVMNLRRHQPKSLISLQMQSVSFSATVDRSKSACLDLDILTGGNTVEFSVDRNYPSEN